MFLVTANFSLFCTIIVDVICIIGLSKIEYKLDLVFMVLAVVVNFVAFICSGLLLSLHTYLKLKKITTF